MSTVGQMAEHLYVNIFSTQRPSDIREPEFCNSGSLIDEFYGHEDSPRLKGENYQTAVKEHIASKRGRRP